jgi:hypothetical protein
MQQKTQQPAGGNILDFDCSNLGGPLIVYQASNIFLGVTIGIDFLFISASSEIIAKLVIKKNCKFLL